MKNIKFKYSLGLFLAISLVFLGCQDDDSTFGEVKIPTNVTLTAEVLCEDCSDAEGDGSGLVDLVATASGALSYTFSFGDGFSETNQTGKVTHLFTSVGVNTYTVVVNAVGTGGVQSSTTLNVTVRSDFEDIEAKDFLSGGIGNNKTWYWGADKPSNIALGANIVDEAGGIHTFPTYYNAEPFAPDKICMYDAELVFTQDADGNLSFQQVTSEAYVPGTVAGVLGVDGDTCHGKDVAPTLGEISNVALIPSSSIATEDAVNPEYRGTSILLSDDGFMSWYCLNSLIEIITLTDSELKVRIVDGANAEFAWYCTFQTQNPNELPDGGFDDLVWSDEFDTNGAPNSENWTYDLGTGDNGWGNGELQDYTDSENNVIVKEGVLKITAIADGDGYTSARIKTQGLQQYKYGRIEAKAKLPVSQGTWPAIWMLGANFADVGWPNCGEIDIMEQDSDKTQTSGALHFPGNSGGDAVTEKTTVANTDTEFHIYAVEWTAESIKLSVDGEFFLTFENNADVPYNADMFMILNLAMGGNLGGTVDPDFTQDTMEVDYIRVYQ